MGVQQLVTAMDEAATQDIRMVQLWPIIKQVLGTPSNTQSQEAIAKLESWFADGGHRRDLTNQNIASPGTYQHNEAITVMDAWWPKLLEAEFRPALGNEAFGAVQCCPSAVPTPGANRRPQTSLTAGTATSARTCATCSPPTARGPRRRPPTRRSTAEADR
jgi:hypothetical protein